MMQEEAARLQRQIYMTHPYLPVVVRTLGHEQHPEYACLIEGVGYYIWTIDDWYYYCIAYADRLHQFTERARLALNKRKGKHKNRAKHAGLHLV